MPLSEFHRALTKGKPESAQPKISNCPSDVSSFMPDHEFVELLWENGQIVMQGQSNRPKKSSFPTAFPSHNLRFQDKDCGDGAMHKIRQFESMDSTVNELSHSVPSGIGLNAQDDIMPPWINYPVEDPLCSEFFSELSGINQNSLSADKNNGFGDKDLHNMEHRHPMKPLKEASEPSRTRASQVFQLPQQCQGLNLKSRVTDLGISGSSSSTQLGHFQRQDVVTTPSKSLHSSSGASLLNFSHFSRPAALAKASIQSSERSRSNEKASSAAASTNPIESTLIESTGFQGNSTLDLPRVEMRSVAKLCREVVSVEQPEAVHHEDVSRNNHQNNSGNKIGTSSDQINHQNSSFAVNMALGRHDTEKGPEAVVTSSVCSGNSAGAASTDPKQKAKRKSREGEESGYLSEDIEDVSVDLRKPNTGRVGTSMKRSRAAEVHNLSERRRRDRINEKMRALQELIPNCNKVDKASMLDEAIEYLKTLQLQVQMMSMGSGLCMPPMMLPPGMQHIRVPPMVHFPHMGVGMGMGVGLGYGMGMLDMNNSRGCPLIPVPSMHTPQFPCPSIPAATGLHGMQGSAGLQLFGIPGHGQGLPVSMAHAPLFSPLSGLAAKGNLTHEASGTRPTTLPVSDVAPSSSKDQQQQGMNLEVIQKASMNGTQVAKEPFEHPQLVRASNQTLHAGGSGAINSINDTGNASTRKTNYG